MPQSFQQVSSDLWVAQSEVYTTNSGIFFETDRACLVDPAVLPEDIRAIRRLVDDHRLKVESIVLTHHHWDHLFGPEHFPQVNVITHNYYKKELTSEESDHTLEQALHFEREYKIRRSKPFRLPAADITFEKSMMMLLGSLALELIHAPGHSADQVVLYQAQNGILWAADMLSDLEIPFIFHSLEAYRNTLEKLHHLDIRLLIPGHGHTTDQPEEIHRRFENDLVYLSELHQRVGEAIGAGKGLYEAQARCANMQFKHPQENANPHRRNVEAVFYELSQK